MKSLALATTLVFAACGGSKAGKVCENFNTQCGGGMSPSDLAQCGSDLASLENEVGSESYDEFVACGADAASCGEAMGCATGLMFKGGSKFLSNFEKGFNKAAR